MGRLVRNWIIEALITVFVIALIAGAFYYITLSTAHASVTEDAQAERIIELEEKLTYQYGYVSRLKAKLSTQYAYNKSLKEKLAYQYAYVKRMKTKLTTAWTWVHYWKQKNYWSSRYKPGRPYTEREFKALAHMAGWPDHLLPKLTRVARCESGLRWYAYSGYYVGLMQHRPGNGGYTRAQLSDPLINLRQAWLMYEDRGWQPWPTCRYR